MLELYCSLQPKSSPSHVLVAYNKSPARKPSQWQENPHEIQKINAAGWPAQSQGVKWPYQLVRINGQSVANAAQVDAALTAYESIILRDGVIILEYTYIE
jgi:hypothetical protein